MKTHVRTVYIAKCTTCEFESKEYELEIDAERSGLVHTATKHPPPFINIITRVKNE